MGGRWIKTALLIEPDLELARLQRGLLLLFDNYEPIEARVNSIACARVRTARCCVCEAIIALSDN